MNTENDSRGFEEIPHTADWALRIWAPDFPSLLSTAIQGMQNLMELVFLPGEPVKRTITVDAIDQESLLVLLVSEVLFWVENEGLGVEQFEGNQTGQSLRAAITLRPVAHSGKEIKAVTYHNLSIKPTPRGLEATLVFDV